MVLRHLKREALTELARALVRRPSVVEATGEGTEAPVAAYVAERLRARGLSVSVEEVAPGRPNVIAVLEGRQGPGRTLLFEAHSDVVTAGDPAAWSVPPFEGVVRDGRLYGRGACDTKGNLAAAILALEALQAAGAPFRGRVLLVVPVDEEGMMLGIKHFIERGWADEVDAAISCEPEGNQLCVVQKGALRLRVTARGTMCHGAMPLTGLNPIGPLAAIVRKLQELEREEIARLGRHAYLGYPSFTPTVLRAPVAGEAQLNVVPAAGELLVDVRTVPGQDHEALERRLAEIVAATERAVHEDLRAGPGRDLRESLEPGLSERVTFAAELEVLERRPWTRTDPQEPVVRAFAEAYRQLTGREPVYNGVPGATDGTFLWAWKGIPLLTTGAGDRHVPHQVDEWVDLEELWTTARLYALGALRFLHETA